jgi:hypothetical protein
MTFHFRYVFQAASGVERSSFSTAPMNSGWSTLRSAGAMPARSR